MTGIGSARKQHEHLCLTAEIRSVNNRYLKVSVKVPDAYVPLEGEIEKLVRGTVGRGTVLVDLRAAEGEGRYVLNQTALESYWRQLHQLAEKIHVAAPTDLGGLLGLPGVVHEADAELFDAGRDRSFVCEVIGEALESLQSFRTAEGRSMQQDLRGQTAEITRQLENIASLAPQVVSDYRDRLKNRLEELLRGAEVEIDDADLIREMSIFADRCDINEEITRLKSHLDQFDTFLEEEKSQGRKLEFLGQEMFREVNTIGSKANNVEIAHCVVGMKAAIEKMREILQNVE